MEGRLQTRKWQDKTTNQDRYTTEIIADTLEMLGGKAQGTGSDAPAMEKAAAMEPAGAVAMDNFDDDIPF